MKVRYSPPLFALTIAVAALVAQPVSAAPVGASPEAVGKAVIQRPLSLARLTDLDFGTVVASSSAAGTVSINAVTGARSFGGGVTGLSGSPGTRAAFAGSGIGNVVVRVTLTPPAALVEPISGQQVPVIAMGLDGSPFRFTDSDGAFYVGVGGQIGIAANQIEGDYSAAINLTADYF